MATEPTAAALAAAEKYERKWVPYTFGPLAGMLLDHAKPGPGERVLN